MALLRSVATVGGYTMASRVLGFVRDVLTANFLGAGPVADAFFVAFRLPNLFRSFFAEGAFSAAFVPLFAGSIAQHGHHRAKHFAEEALAALTLVLFIFVVICEALAPAILHVLAPALPPIRKNSRSPSSSPASPSPICCLFPWSRCRAGF